jgi:hypothetical protein
MKRISMLLMLSAFVPSLCQGVQSHNHSSHFSSRSTNYLLSQSDDYSVRYSPYALSYSSTGLIPGGLNYSPYAFGPGQSGLVYEGTRYTPYASDYNHSGLVLDYAAYPIPICPAQVVVVQCPCANRASEPTATTTRIDASPYYGRAQQSLPDRSGDPMNVIRQYLAGRGFNSVDINYLWSIDSKTVAASFVLRDKGVAIRFRDSETIDSHATQAQRISGERQNQAWEAFAKSFKANGGSVYSISGSGKEQIVAALDACQVLRPQDSTATEAVKYAKQ